MVYMKGWGREPWIASERSGGRLTTSSSSVPDAPQCGFSKRVVQLLQTVGVEFAARDVLADPELRQGVKV